MIDSFDMNIRQSYKRTGRTTKSYHFCNAYAALNRVNTSSLADHPPSGVLSPDLILPCKDDLDKILDEFSVLVSRYVFTCSMIYYFYVFSFFKGYCTVFARIQWTKFISGMYMPSEYSNEMSKIPLWYVCIMLNATSSTFDFYRFH